MRRRRERETERSHFQVTTQEIVAWISLWLILAIPIFIMLLLKPLNYIYAVCSIHNSSQAKGSSHSTMLDMGSILQSIHKYHRFTASWLKTFCQRLTSPPHCWSLLHCHCLLWQRSSIVIHTTTHIDVFGVTRFLTDTPPFGRVIYFHPNYLT